MEIEKVEGEKLAVKAGSELNAGLGEDDDDDYADGDEDCTHCGGEGYREVDDIFWDDCDHNGFGPCTSCKGTGLRRHQWVF